MSQGEERNDPESEGSGSWFHWTCTGCGWRNVLMRLRCRNCDELRPEDRTRFSWDEVLMGLANIGVDTKCGACLEVFFTSATVAKHSCLDTREEAARLRGELSVVEGKYRVACEDALRCGDLAAKRLAEVEKLRGALILAVEVARSGELVWSERKQGVSDAEYLRIRIADTIAAKTEVVTRTKESPQ